MMVDFPLFTVAVLGLVASIGIVRGTNKNRVINVSWTSSIFSGIVAILALIGIIGLVNIIIKTYPRIGNGGPIFSELFPAGVSLTTLGLVSGVVFVYFFICTLVGQSSKFRYRVMESATFSIISMVAIIADKA